VIVCANDNYKAGEELVEPTVEYTITGAQGLRAFPVIAAKIGDTKYKTLASAVKAVKEGETINILGTLSEGSIKLPSTLKNVTFSGEEGATLKDMTINASDGSTVHYDGLTFNNITFDNSIIVFTGSRTGEVVYKNIAIKNCEFKNIVRTGNYAAFHFTGKTFEALNGFTFEDNIINGVTGSSNSGVNLMYCTGEVNIKNNVINNVAFRPYVIQITTDDSIADRFVVTGNTFSGSTVGRAQGLGSNATGTDEVEIKVSENIFKDITEAQQICYYNFNAATTTAVLSHNYYDIDIAANPSKILYNAAAESVADLVEMGVYPIYTALNADGTIDTNSLYTPTQE
jgi:hypothetical protein